MNSALKSAVPQYEEMQKTDPLPSRRYTRWPRITRPRPPICRPLQLSDAGRRKGLDRQDLSGPRHEGKTARRLRQLFDELGQRRIQDLQADYEKVQGWVEASQLDWRQTR